MASRSDSTDDVQAPTTRWGLFRNVTFTVILLASAVSNMGEAMFDTASNWLMTGMNPDPFMVSAVQVAVTLPMFLLTLPAGALSDIVDARKLLIGVEGFNAVVAIAFAAVVTLNWQTPGLLLATGFLLGVGGALGAPAWQLVPPMTVPASDLDKAIAINGASYNLTRAIGPAIGGLLIAGFGVSLPIWVNGLTSLAIVAALLWWRAPVEVEETLPAERWLAAVRTGLRYARNSRDIDATLIRAIAYFPFASAYFALLPLIARKQMGDGPQVYGAMLGVIGVGSIAGSYGLNKLKARLDPDRIAAVGTLGTIVALVFFGAARGPFLAFAACIIAGAAWIVVMTTLFMSAQVALPEWVRGRGLAVFLTVFFGAMTLGSAIWGKIASVGGISLALYVSAAGALAAIPLTWHWKLQTGAALDLTPSMHWRTPVIVQHIENDQGPILITVEYRIDPSELQSFLALMREIGRERMRDGAYAWNVFVDPTSEGRLVETCLIQSLLELKHLRARVTEADRLIEQQALKFLKAPPSISYLVAAKSMREPWRRLP